MFQLYKSLDVSVRESLKEYDDLTSALLARRGITNAEDAKSFLNPSYDKHIHDPLLMKNMQIGAERLTRAILKKEHVAVWSDYDCDGIPAGVLLHDFLKKMKADFENYIPHRHNEGYGINKNGIAKLIANNTSLIITADVGITDVDAIAYAREQGIDVIVTDHHLPGEVLPDAIVIDPKAHTDETYPFKELCGAGLAWKLCTAALSVSPELRSRASQGWEKWLLDMAGLATIADMVPLTGENRVIASYGLRVLRKSPRIGLQKLCRSMRVNQSTFREDDVGFMLAPRINAASRMGEAGDAFELLTTTDESRAEVLSKKLEKLNRERKAQVGAITRALHTKLKERKTIPRVIALGDPVWRPSLLGLAANTISDEYGCPVFLWGRDGDNSAKGSCRSGDSSNLVELMRLAEEVFVGYGGHAASGGFTVKEEKIFVLEDVLSNAHEQMISKSETETSSQSADAEIPIESITLSFLNTLEHMAPFGEQNPKPVFALRDLAVGDVSRFGKSHEHVKISFHDEIGRHRTDGIIFFVKGALLKKIDQLVTGGNANILAHLERDPFSRARPVRLRILDVSLV